MNSEDYAYVPDPKLVSTWKLPLVDGTGTTTARQVSMAVAALGEGGFRGEKVQIPAKDLAAVKSKVLAAWKKVNPDAKPEDVPQVLRKGVEMTVEEMSKRLDEAEANLQVANDLLAKQSRELTITKLSDEDRQAYDALPDTDKDTFHAGNEEAQETLLEKSRTAIAKAAEAAKVIPEEVRKQMDELSKRLADSEARATRAEEIAKKADDERQMTELAKRAENEFAGLPGTPVEKALVLKSLSKLTDTEQEGIYKLLRAGNECLAKFVTSEGVGKSVTDAGTINDAYARIENMSKARAERDKITVHKAMSLVISENPKMYEEYLANNG